MPPRHISCGVLPRKRRRAAALQSALRAQKSKRPRFLSSLSGPWRVAMLAAAILIPLSSTGCGKKGQNGEKKTTQKSEDDFLDKDAKPDERKYLLAAKPFFVAIANRKYADAYALLSRYAKARMSFNQFSPAEDDSDSQQSQSYAFDNVTVEQFAYLMQYVEAAHGAPRAPKMLHVFSTNPDVLNRRSKEQFGA